MAIDAKDALGVAHGPYFPSDSDCPHGVHIPAGHRRSRVASLLAPVRPVYRLHLSSGPSGLVCQRCLF
jgi:hypothetical protein